MNSNSAVLWKELIDDWLALKGARSASAHTRRSYEATIARWQTFLASCSPPTDLWEAEVSHVRRWQQALRAEGLAESSVNQRLSCVSSFYAFVQREWRLVKGVETPVFADAVGHARANPFRAENVERGQSLRYERARILSRDELLRVLGWLEENALTVAGARNRALVLTFLYTGWRSGELMRMRWGDIRPSRVQAGTSIYAWRGPGNQRADDVLPAVCFEAICAYLRLAGRLGTGSEPARNEAIWLPVAEPHMEQPLSSPIVDAKRPITEQSALRVLRSALRGAGIAGWESYRIHDLRHTHAFLLLESGQSLEVLQQRLHHLSAATTGFYVRTVHGREPEDVVSDAFGKLLGTAGHD